MEKLEIGKLYIQDRTYYKEETRFDYTQAGAKLEIFFNRPTIQEIRDITKGELRIGFAEVQDIIFMLFRFGKGEFMDAPYTVHLSVPFEFEELVENSGYGLLITLVDASNGILKGMRLVGFSNEFSKAFRQVVERQKACKFNTRNYDATLNMIFDQYSTADLVNMAEHWN